MDAENASIVSVESRSLRPGVKLEERKFNYAWNLLCSADQKKNDSYAMLLSLLPTMTRVCMNSLMAKFFFSKEIPLGFRVIFNQAFNLVDPYTGMALEIIGYLTKCKQFPFQVLQDPTNFGKYMNYITSNSPLIDSCLLMIGNSMINSQIMFEFYSSNGILDLIFTLPPSRPISVIIHGYFSHIQTGQPIPPQIIQTLYSTIQPENYLKNYDHAMCVFNRLLKNQAQLDLDPIIGISMQVLSVSPMSYSNLCQAIKFLGKIPNPSQEFLNLTYQALITNANEKVALYGLKVLCNNIDAFCSISSPDTYDHIINLVSKLPLNIASYGLPLIAALCPGIDPRAIDISFRYLSDDSLSSLAASILKRIYDKSESENTLSQFGEILNDYYSDIVEMSESENEELQNFGSALLQIIS